jgi:acetolactate decarboxylase
MKTKRGALYLVVGALALAGCTSPNTALFEQDTITQVSSYNGLLAALYDGEVPYSELKPYGNFGVGTFNAMDGEMVMIDGVIYQIAFSGKVTVMDPSNVTPYATLVNFKADQDVVLPADTPYDQISALLESKLENPNAPYAVRIDGTFSHIKCRSVPKQEKPYPSLTQIAANQAIFEKDNVKGSIVGFRYPQYAGAFNVPGFHLHFLCDGRDFGGHVLAFTTGTGAIAKLDKCTRLMVFIPDNEAGRTVDLNRDLSADVQNVNRSK